MKNWPFYKVTAYMCCINSIGGVLELATAVPILLTLPISVSPYEHRFSKIKLMRLYLWSTMSPDKTCKSYRSLSWEWSSVSINFNNVIKDLADILWRRVQFWVSCQFMSPNKSQLKKQLSFFIHNMLWAAIVFIGHRQ